MENTFNQIALLKHPAIKTSWQTWEMPWVAFARRQRRWTVQPILSERWGSDTFPETNSKSPWKIGRLPQKEAGSSSKHLRCNSLVSFREGSFRFPLFFTILYHQLSRTHLVPAEKRGRYVNSQGTVRRWLYWVKVAAPEKINVFIRFIHTNHPQGPQTLYKTLTFPFFSARELEIVDLSWSWDQFSESQLRYVSAG